MRVSGEGIVPGDKSITHRVLYLAGLARSPSRIEGALISFDTRATAGVLRALGVGVSPLRPGAVVSVTPSGPWRAPQRTLDCANSGTSARLGLGLLASHPFEARLSGDQSLRRRPMRRVTEPLTLMGAAFAPAEPDRLPFKIRGGDLRPLRWELPVSSAQLKSALLLAGWAADVPVAVREPSGRSRDHTERLLRGLGFEVADRDDGWIELPGGGRPDGFEFSVPGDPSSAAFLVGAALMAESGELALRRVGLNPTRTGFLDVCRRMGAELRIEDRTEQCGEPRGTIVARASSLRATVVTAGEIPGLIDEIPMLAVLASRAAGTTRFEEVGELRVKESDRLGLLASNLAALGVEAHAERNTLTVVGGDTPPRGRVATDGDHRIAMAFAVMGTVPGAQVSLDDTGCVGVSFPGFFDTLHRIGR